MLLPDNIHPHNSIYYNGAMVLDILSKNNNIEMLDLYQKVKKNINMSFPTFILSLDWLYLVDIAKLQEEKVKLCF